MSAVPEPGPYYHGLIEVGAENCDNWEVVTVRANNPATRRGDYRDRPIPTPALLKWIRDSGIDFQDVKLSEYELVNPLRADPYFVVELYWFRQQDALLFKLAWGAL